VENRNSQYDFLNDHYHRDALSLVVMSIYMVADCSYEIRFSIGGLKFVIPSFC